MAACQREEFEPLNSAYFAKNSESIKSGKS